MLLQPAQNCACMICAASAAQSCIMGSFYRMIKQEVLAAAVSCSKVRAKLN